MELNYSNWIYDCVVFVSLNLLLLVIWFHTNAFVEYVRFLFIGNKFFKLEDFEKQSQITGVSYPEFLLIEKDCFFTRLISCPFCICFWMCVIESFYYKDALIGVLLFYPTIFLYFLLSLIIKKINE